MIDPDATLLGAVQAGDGAALTTLYRQYATPVYAFIRRRLPTTEAAEDVTSETFLAVVEQVRSFRSDATFKNWVYAIARRRVAEYWRRHYRLPELAIDAVLSLLAASAEGDVHPPAETWSRADLDRVLAELPERARSVLTCRFLDGRSVAETAEHLSLSEANVKVIQHRALAKAADIAKRLCVTTTTTN